MTIKYKNMPANRSRSSFLLRYYFNIFRSWYLFTIKYPWVQYEGFVRVMKGTSFAKMSILIGDHVQFGPNCNIFSKVKFGNQILLAGSVSFIGKNDHQFNIPGQYIWDGERGEDGVCVVEDDVWIGHGSIIVGGIRISRGSIVAAGSVVTKDIPECEIWGGVPAKKLKDRFSTHYEKMIHLEFLSKNTE